MWGTPEPAGEGWGRNAGSVLKLWYDGNACDRCTAGCDGWKQECVQSPSSGVFSVYEAFLNVTVNPNLSWE